MPDKKSLSAENVRILSFRALVPQTVLRDALDSPPAQPVADIAVMRRRTELEQELAETSDVQEAAKICQRLDDEEAMESNDFDVELRRLATRRLIELFLTPAPVQP